MKSTNEESKVYCIVKMAGQHVNQEILEELNYGRSPPKKKVCLSSKPKINLDWGQTRNAEDLLEVFSPEATEFFL
jgi:hypothetical protein